MIQVFRHGNKITIFVIMKKRLSASIASSALIFTTCIVCFSANHIHPDYFNANVEALASSEYGADICTSPKTWLGLGTCMNVTSVICKDDSGECD